MQHASILIHYLSGDHEQAPTCLGRGGARRAAHKDVLLAGRGRRQVFMRNFAEAFLLGRRSQARVEPLRLPSCAVAAPAIVDAAHELICVALCAPGVLPLDSDVLFFLMIAFQTYSPKLIACTHYSPWLLQQAIICVLGLASQVEPAPIKII